MSDLINRDALVKAFREKADLYMPNMFATESECNVAKIVAMECANIVKDAPTVPTFGDWVNLNDRSPDENGVYLVYGYDMLNHGITFECDARYHCLNDDICKWDLGTHTRLYKVTHWMPLPKPPKEAQYAAD